MGLILMLCLPVYRFLPIFGVNNLLDRILMFTILFVAVSIFRKKIIPSVLNNVAFQGFLLSGFHIKNLIRGSFFYAVSIGFLVGLLAPKTPEMFVWYYSICYSIINFFARIEGLILQDVGINEADLSDAETSFNWDRIVNKLSLICLARYNYPVKNSFETSSSLSFPFIVRAHMRSALGSAWKAGKEAAKDHAPGFVAGAVTGGAASTYVENKKAEAECIKAEIERRRLEEEIQDRREKLANERKRIELDEMKQKLEEDKFEHQKL